MLIDRKVFKLVVVLLFSGALSTNVSAQSIATAGPDGTMQAGSSGAAAMPALMEAHRVDSDIAIDGVLDEAPWQEARFITDFLQTEPNEGSAATHRTEVRVLYGPNHVYIGAYLYDSEPDKIQQTLGQRDNMNRADWFTVSIDSYFDKKSAYTFGVNAAGVQYDAYLSGGGGGGGGMGGGMGDRSWNAIWESDVRIASDGWIVEMRIPYSMLRFSNTDMQTWGVQFTRDIARLGEDSEWPFVPRTQRASLVAQYGELHGIRGISPRANIQVSPYTVSRLTTEEDSETPGRMSGQAMMDAGGDVKVGLGSSVTLDATFNPDFGQVESDPAQLNLTAFETVNQEQRPFFVEGIQTYRFQVGPASLLNTRRIGAEDRIIGAAKLSGRTVNGLSFGVLGAVTGDNFNPTRNYALTRVSQRVGSFSSLGGIVTAFDGPEDEGRQRSFTSGADWDFRLLDNAYSVSGAAAMTHRRWTAGDESPETGFGGQINAQKREGAFTFRIGAEAFDVKFNPNEVGRIQRSNQILAFTFLDYDLNNGRPFGPFQRASVGTTLRQSWSYDTGLNQGNSIMANSNWTTRKFQSINLSGTFQDPLGGYDLFETRGLWARAQPREVRMNGSFNTDSRRSFRLRIGGNVAYHETGGRAFGMDLGPNWNLGSRVTLSATVGADWANNVLAWASNEAFVQDQGEWGIRMDADEPSSDDPIEEYDFGYDLDGLETILAGVDPLDEAGHYYVPVYGARDTRTLDFTLRSTVTFTPALSLQFYGQLFNARGRYGDFQILQNPDTMMPFGAFPKRNEFTRNSFQFNTVLRWEYRPGSWLYVVWTQGRNADLAMDPLEDGLSPYDRPLGRQIGDTFGAFPDNVFLIKLNYTILL
jgi:hypothetical protein